MDRNKELNFTYIEPTFNKEIIVGFSNGDVEIIDPFAEDEEIAETKEQIHNKCSKFYDIKSLVKDKAINEPRHEESVVQIKMSDYYPFYVSIADEMIIYQLKEWIIFMFLFYCFMKFLFKFNYTKMMIDVKDNNLLINII